jgi:nucleoside-diphosphate-sugar epimerase
MAGQIAFMRLDLATADLGPAVAGVERIFHLAAIPSVPRSVADPVRTHASIATATLRLLWAAKEAAVARFVHSSSSSIYGNAPESPKHEGLPLAPVSPYGVAKAAAEGYVRVFASLYGMDTISLRYFNVFGPGQDPDSAYAAVIPRFITRALRGEALLVYGDGTQTRDFTYVDNVVDANLCAGVTPRPDGRAYNIAAGQPQTVNELCDRLAEIVGGEVTREYGPTRPGDILHSHADVRAAARDLGWRPTVDFATGLKRTVESFRT